MNCKILIHASSSEKENYMLTYQLERCAVMQYSTKLSHCIMFQYIKILSKHNDTWTDLLKGQQKYAYTHTSCRGKMASNSAKHGKASKGTDLLKTMNIHIEDGGEKTCITKH
jgi:hypothetical protein